MRDHTELLTAERKEEYGDIARHGIEEFVMGITSFIKEIFEDV